MTPAHYHGAATMDLTGRWREQYSKEDLAAEIERLRKRLKAYEQLAKLAYKAVHGFDTDTNLSAIETWLQENP